MHRRLKVTLIALFAGILAVVAIQPVWPFLPVGSKLRGSVEEAPAPVWDWEGIRSGRAMRATEKWFDEHVGLRNFWVRLDNQLTYHAFDEAPQDHGGTAVVVGKNDWLYERPYVRHSIETAKPEDERIHAAIRHMRSVQDKLARRGIPFLLIIAPSKAEVYPERIPPAYLAGRNKDDVTTFYERYRPALVEAGINFYDGPRKFLEWRRSGAPGLFSRGGTHWSYYGALKVLNEVRDQLNPGMKHPIPPLVAEKIETVPAQLSDIDLLNILNLLGEFEANHPQPYPVLRAQTAVPAEQLPKILWVHDSFGWPLIELIYKANAAQPSQSLYYFASLYNIPGGVREDTDVRKIDWNTFLPKHDAVIMVWTEIGFTYVGWGFCEAVDQGLP